MVKIIVPERKLQTISLEVEVSEGELILLVNSHRASKDGEINSALLGVFEGLYSKRTGKYEDVDRTYMKLANVYVLNKCGRMGGLDLPCLESRGNVNLCKNTNIKNIYSPQEQIVQVLQSWPGFEAHAEWVSRLRKPYL